jgi:enoyl-CoA hydratase/carnithine racemase
MTIQSSPPAPEGTVTIEPRGAVRIVTLTHPRRRNALSLALREALFEALDEVLADPDCRVVVLTGAEGCFCSGGDISTMQGVDPVAGRRRLQRIHRVVRQLTESEKPILAAVEGWAAGAGISLAAACDIVFAASDARFACSFNKIGLVPDLGATATLTQRMGAGRAKYMMMSGEVFSADQASAMGLVEVVTAPGDSLAQALAMAETMAQTAPLSNAMTKALVARMPAPLSEMLKAEVDAQAVLFGTSDFAEGQAAFMGKRPPVFTGS